MGTRPGFHWWTPPSRYRAMSTSGSIVLWFFFWWVLIPAYLLFGIGWLLLVVSVNVVVNAPAVAWVAVAVCVASVRFAARPALRR